MSNRNRFQQFVAHQPKRKRAGVVCVACHEKKIKCDMEGTSQRGDSSCTNCAVAGCECRTRPSNRAPRKRPLEQARHVLNTAPRGSPTAGEPLLPPNEYGAVVTNLPSPRKGLGAEPLPELLVGSTPASGDELQQRISPRNQINDQPPQSSRNNAADSYLGQSGFMDVWALETEQDADRQLQEGAHLVRVELLPSELQQAFQEAYFQFCYTWCPILDRETLSSELEASPLLMNALAVAGSHIEPSTIDPAEPATYYGRAKELFYGDKEEDLIMCLKAMSLFYWWSPRPPSRVHRDSSWWWTTAAIRHAQQAGFHREPKPGHTGSSSINQRLRRKIWWTLFARERLTALCQDRPCVIDPDDCDIQEPCLEDFPVEEVRRAEIFIRWIRLCAVIGRVAKHLSRPASTSAFPTHLAQELMDWVHALPPSLMPSIASERTTNFDRDNHQLHLPYLAVVIVLHLSPSSQALPKAYPAAIIAASCIARILKDCLARGRIRYLMAICCWYCGIALLALLQARNIERLRISADGDIRILLVALKELRIMWPTADIFLRGFERLHEQARSEIASSGTRNPIERVNDTADLEDISSNHGINWPSYVPYATVETSGLAKLLLPENGIPYMNFDFMTLQMSELFDPFDDYLDPLPALPIF